MGRTEDDVVRKEEEKKMRAFDHDSRLSREETKMAAVDSVTMSQQKAVELALLASDDQIPVFRPDEEQGLYDTDDRIQKEQAKNGQKERAHKKANRLSNAVEDGEPSTSSTTGDLDLDVPMEVSTEFMARTIQAAVNFALASDRAGQDDCKDERMQFVVREPVFTTSSAGLDDSSANTHTPTTAPTPPPAEPVRPGAYDRRPGESARRRGTFHPEQFRPEQIDATLEDMPALPLPPEYEQEELSNPEPQHRIERRSASTLGLVEAKPVEEDEGDSEILEATEIDMSEMSNSDRIRRRKSQRMFWGCGISGCFVVVLIIVLAITLTQNSKSVTNRAFTAAPTASPTTAPTMSPLFGILPDYTQEVIILDDEKSSAQYKAYEWLQEDYRLNSTRPTEKLLQRFALATFYYSTNGEGWTKKGANPLYELETLDSNTSCPGGPDAGGFSGPPDVGAGGGPPGGGSGGPPQGVEPVKFYNGLWLDHVVDECQWYSKNHMERCRQPPLCVNGTYHALILASNNLEGTIPPELSLLSDLKANLLIKNNLEGSLPIQLFQNWKKINLIDYASNRLTGSIPTEIGLFTALGAFDVSQNQFRGSIPSEVFQVPWLDALVVSDNEIEGVIPTEVGLATALTQLGLENNRLIGTIASEIGRLSKLTALTLARNQLNSTIPTELGLCSQMQRLELGNNLFTGSIPSQLGLVNDWLMFKAEENDLDSQIPRELGRWSRLEVFNVAGNERLSGRIPDGLGIFTFENGTNVSMLKELNLNGTRLGGSLATEWCEVKTLIVDCSTFLCGCDCDCG